jgi:urea transport system permease protein
MCNNKNKIIFHFKLIQHYLFVLLLSMAILFSPSSVAEEPSNQLGGYLSQLGKANYKKKEKLIHSISMIGDPRAIDIFKKFLAGELYYRKSDKKIVFATKSEKGYVIVDALSGDNLGETGKRKVKKIGVNNKLRGVLKNEIAKLSLSHKKTEVRLNAVTEIIKGINSDSAVLLRNHLLKESNNEIIELINEGLALIDIKSEDKVTRLEAIKVLSGSLLPEAKVSLEKILKRDENGNYLEMESSLRKAASSGISTIDEKLKINNFVETVFFGLSLGSVLLLVAIGLAITFGVMGVINMAHGELMMLGAYTTYLIQLAFPDYIEYSLFMAIPAAFIVSGLFGIAIERGVIRFLYGRPLETLLATFGVSLILQQLVRTVISAQNVTVETPMWMSGSLQINPALSITYNRLYIIIFSLVVFFGLMMILKKTVLGLQVRAVSQNRSMAKAIGVRSEWVDALTFGLGSGVAGIAGVALSQLTNVGPNLGQSYIIDSFMVVVFGGVGNLWGTLVGAMSLGVVNKFLEPWMGAVLAKIIVLVFIILFIQKKPRGLFPQKGRAAEN